ncbi:hypothetical protein ACWFQ8_05405 [Streptomyces sp. NPDC055254]
MRRMLSRAGEPEIKGVPEGGCSWLAALGTAEKRQVEDQEQSNN